MKRLFISIPLSKNIIKTLSRYRDGIGRQTPYLRWTPIKNLHITALFIGDTDEAHIPDLNYEIEQAIFPIKPFELVFGRTIYAPPNRPTSMVWLKLESSSGFLRLVSRLNRRVKYLAIKYPKAFPGFLEILSRNTSTLPCQRVQNAKAQLRAIDKELGHISPHITLARFDRKARIPRKLIPLKKTGIEHSYMEINNCILMSSKLTASGPIFTEIETFAFNEKKN